ncbi:hypothetical protein P691DRAFT_786841 [Macrolepiota fuliginosa MF-IS2]|uniref:Uncharacterized protein n=1 Tax=Macrolepiota fuliginosa MF-IS2 TaxID=1400762 RepID=A0A9P6C089_9AGAR|nr:hypothetical protein P691DRAFT_786841 [Macrolepiota fuliginosa MF-IS2]
MSLTPNISVHPPLLPAMSDTDPILSHWEAADLISSTTVNGVLYGIALSLYVLSARSFYPQLKDKDKQKHATFMFAYTSLVMICGTIYLALDTQDIQLAYIGHNTHLGEPREFEFIYSTSLPSGIAMNIFSVMIDFSTIGIQIWRLWVIYGATRYKTVVIILPTLLFLCYIATTIVYVLPVGDELFRIANGISIGSQLVIEVFVTTMVIVSQFWFLVWFSDTVLTTTTGASDASKEYMSIVTMLIESYALESAWTLAGLILYFLDSEPSAGAAFTFFADCDSAIEVIAYLLVVYRVFTGRAWNKQTEEQISSLRFQAGNSAHSTAPGTTTQTSQAISDVGTVPNSLPPDHSVV